MPSNIILKKSSVVAKVPVAGDLQFGELALNYADGKLYYKKSDGTTIDSFQAGSGGGGGGVSSFNTRTGAVTLSSGDVTTALGFTPGNVTLAGTETLTNKRITPRITVITSSSTITPTSDASDQYEVTALAEAATLVAPSGTPTSGQKLIIRIKDNGTARALTWSTNSGAYRAVGVTLPTTTVLSKVLYIACIYNSQDLFWDVLAVAQLP